MNTPGTVPVLPRIARGSLERLVCEQNPLATVVVHDDNQRDDPLPSCGCLCSLSLTGDRAGAGALGTDAGEDDEADARDRDPARHLAEQEQPDGERDRGFQAHQGAESRTRQATERPQPNAKGITGSRSAKPSPTRGSG